MLAGGLGPGSMSTSHFSVLSAGLKTVAPKGVKAGGRDHVLPVAGTRWCPHLLLRR